jgi:hypothetical protein
MGVREWLQKNFDVKHIQNGEALIVCPSCYKEKLYFNIGKKVGYCHWDRCKFHISGIKLITLIQLAGDRPDTLPVWTDEEPPPVIEVALPEEAKPVVTMKDGKYFTINMDALGALCKRGVTPEAAYRFDLHIDDSRVYIPVYQGGVLKQYVGRAWWWLPKQSSLRYKYASGISIKKFLFNYDAVKRWDQVTLVENTFNGIWLRDIKFTSNFGSDLSAEQIQLLSRSGVKSVALLWDEGAEAAAEKCVNRLTKHGIPSSFGVIREQPDNHTIEWLEQASNELHATDKQWLDFT